MNTFISFSRQFNELLSFIMNDHELHARWLNTLSFLENCGARKIAACEHPTFVKEEMIKHASEEFRHAHYLKKQIGRISDQPLLDYSLKNILGAFGTYHYLSMLDLKTSIYLSKVIGLPKQEVRSIAYLLVTYAIELRADELYKIYDEMLRKNHSKITVKSILLEEKEHLEEMRTGINQLSNGEEYACEVCLIESVLCEKWINSVYNSQRRDDSHTSFCASNECMFSNSEPLQAFLDH